jgi:hypothetical protein
MESIAWLEESIAWPQAEIRAAATLDGQLPLQAIIKGTPCPDRIRRAAAGDWIDARAGDATAFGQKRADRPDGNRGGVTMLGGAGPEMADDGPIATGRVGTSRADASTNLVALADPIDVWYGDRQKFGAPGEAQRWVNVLGHVSTRGLMSLSYSLNGGPEHTLAFGPDTRRLNNPGDFNIELDYNCLDPSASDDLVRISAMFGNGEIFSEDVTIDYEGGDLWRTAYIIDWEAVASLQDVVQVVDGLWSFDTSGVRPALQGYDRLLAIGDQSWDSYEVSLAITTHDLTTVDPRGRDGGAFAVGMLWDGHTDNPVAGFQPHAGWIPGALFGFTTRDGGTVRLRASNYVDVLDAERFQLEEGLTYNLKVRNERIDGFDRTYSLKIWGEGEAEPADWLVQGTEAFSELVTGSVLLNAHYFGVTFGDITVVPLSH